MEASLDYKAQGVAYRRLLAAVVGMAIQDAQSRPRKLYTGKKLIPTDEALSAIDFLFRTSDGYLSLLDIDSGRFRKNLLNLMFDMNRKIKQFEPIGRRNFRYNYQWMHRRENVVDMTRIYEQDINKLEEDKKETLTLDRGCWERGCCAHDERDGDGVTIEAELKEKNT